MLYLCPNFQIDSIANMPTEIERKFLVNSDNWRGSVSKQKTITQGYLANTDRGSIRIRVTDDSASLNIKSMTLGVRRSEYDYPVPLTEAREILDTLCMQPLIEKTRYYIEQENHTWEIDVFTGANSGLVVAEIELSDTEEEFSRPDWLGPEISDEPRYYNVCLVEKPYSSW